MKIFTDLSGNSFVPRSTDRHLNRILGGLILRLKGPRHAPGDSARSASTFQRPLFFHLPHLLKPRHVAAGAARQPEARLTSRLDGALASVHGLPSAPAGMPSAMLSDLIHSQPRRRESLRRRPSFSASEKCCGCRQSAPRRKTRADSPLAPRSPTELPQEPTRLLWQLFLSHWRIGAPWRLLWTCSTN